MIVFFLINLFHFVGWLLRILYSLWCPYPICNCYTLVELQMLPCSEYILQSDQVYTLFILNLS